MNRFSFFALLLMPLLLLGCQQAPSSPTVASPSPISPAATVTPTLSIAATSTPSKAPAASPLSVPSATPLATATTAPSPSALEKPPLSDFAKSLEPAIKTVFNKTKAFYEVSQGQWVVDDYTPMYRYQLFVRLSKTSGWSSFETPVTVKGTTATNRTKQVSLTQEGRLTHYFHSAVLKCYNWSYEIEMQVSDYELIGTEFRRSLGPALLSHLVDACPD